ncbi:zinc finger MYM-type protein 1-like [Zingiber officinale]|uniref:zinc finger MYM-type protein 1-like n=1 Tax=Zingiber officinale TaxID=94328 RepID=UPI001C4B1BA0|nr:zinc finger MYM-type protein 1-like [Zingiber officinale]
MKNKKIFDFFRKKNDESTSDLNGPNNISPCISEPASTKRPRLENETLNEPLPNSSNNLQYVYDPGIRIPILQHPIELQDEVRRAYIDKGPIQPIYDYPFTECEGQKRRFQSSWFQKYPWLEFSIEKQSAFCFPCYVFDTNSAQFDTFTVTGFKNWKRVNYKNCPFKRHEGDGNSRHSFAMRKWGDLKNLDQHIDRRLEKQSSKQIEQNRLLLKVSIESVKFLAMQGCAFRGHDESIASKNHGNYLELVALLGRMNPEIGSTLEKASKNAKYTSPEIQREILKIIADIVRDKIRAKIGEAKFCILVDEAIDESSKEQMAIILRYVDRDEFIRERFFEVVHVENTSALTLKKEICNVFNQYNLLTKNLRGQGYDGASNMRGEWNGLQALFLKDSPHAYYIHCFAHRLQLALVAVSKEVHDVWRFFSTLTLAINFVGSSAKHQFQLKSIRKAKINDLIKLGEIDTGTGSNQDCSLVRAGATRWSSHFSSVRRFISLFGSVSTLLQDLVDKGPNSNIRGEAKGLYLDIKSFDFVFVLFLMHEVLGISDKLCQTLQKNDIDILNAINLVSTTRLNLQQIRDDRWEGFLWSVLKFCESNDVEVPDFDDCYTRGTKRSCQQKNNIIVHDHYHFEIFNAVIDFQLMELNERFPEDTTELLTLSNALSPVDGFKSFSFPDICSLVDKFYYYDFNLEERGDLERELDHYKFDIPRHAQFQNLNSLHHLCQTLARTTKSVIYPLIDRLVRLVLTLPVSIATTERAFSGMKLIKMPLRNKMENDLMANTMVVYIERDIASGIDTEFIINKFDVLKNRKIWLK